MFEGGLGNYGIGGDDGDENTDDNDRGEGGGYQILASAGIDRLVNIWTHLKEVGGKGKCKGKGGSNRPGL